MAFVVNAGMNVTANNFYIKSKKEVSLPEVFALFEVLLDIYREYISKIQGYQ